ncbi:hypothetical protein KSW81_000939 [Nannochloris sp. 'desiccata']|nr:hypothetical protein KSW81_000939 [Chlorella desiccata (nom. nud.)]
MQPANRTESSGKRIKRSENMTPTSADVQQSLQQMEIEAAPIRHRHCCFEKSETRPASINHLKLFSTRSINLTSWLHTSLPKALIQLLLLQQGIEPNPGPQINYGDLYTAINPSTGELSKPQQNVYLPPDLHQLMLTKIIALLSTFSPPFLALGQCLLSAQPTNQNIGLALYQALHLCLPTECLETIDTCLESTSIHTLLDLPQIQELIQNNLQIPVDLLTPAPALAPVSAPAETSLLTWNVNGLASKLPVAQNIIHKSNPAIFVLTETHTNNSKQKKNWNQKYFPTYKTFVTSKTKHSAGIMIGISTRYSACLIQNIDPPKQFNGHLLQIKISPPHGSPLSIIGCYCPPNSTPDNTAIRNQIFNYLYRYISEKPTERTLFLGDWNATYFLGSGDTTCRQGDAAFQAVSTAYQLTSAFKNSTCPRQASHDQGGRLDDILCSADDVILQSERSNNHPQILNHPYTGISDHLPVILHASDQDLFSCTIHPIGELIYQQREPTFIRPFPKNQLQAFKQTIATDFHAELSNNQQAMKALLQNHSTTKLDAVDAIHQSIETIQNIYTIAHSFFPKQQPRPPQTTSPPGDAKTWLPSVKGREFTKALTLLTACKKLKSLIKTAMSTPLSAVDLETAAELLPLLSGHLTEQQIPTQNQLSSIINATLGNDLISTLNTLQQKQKEMSDTIRREHHKKEKEHASAMQQKRYKLKKKTVHAEILDISNNTGGPATSAHLASMMHPIKNTTCTCPATVLNALTAHNRILNSVKTPKLTTQYPPWTSPSLDSVVLDTFTIDGLDTFNIEKKADPTTPLLPSLTFQKYQKSLHSLKDGKAIGNDGIPYEILKHLPDLAHEMLYSMFKLMWKFSYTPKEWKTAEITLFQKKDPTYLPANYRPIAVHLTIYKLWTRFITEITQTFVDDNNILHYSQEGFTRDRSTSHAIQLLTLALEDAREFKKDIFVTKLDFTSAYNCINHDKLFYIMSQLGFPQDVIDVLKSLYTDAATILVTPLGRSTAIPQASGATKKGYEFESLKKYSTISHVPEHHKHLPATGYADDLHLIDSSVSNLQQQLNKIELYSEWMGIFLSPPKCEASGIIRSPTTTTAEAALASLTIYNKAFSLDATNQPKIIPGNQSSRFLGTYLSVTLNWDGQLETISTKLKERSALISGCLLTMRQKLLMETWCLFGAIEHTYCVAPYSPHQLAELDKIRAATISKIQHLVRAPTDFIFLAPEDYGLGLESFQERFVKSISKHLLTMLNDKSRLGTAARASLYHYKLKNRVTPVRQPTNNGHLPNFDINDSNTLVRMHKYIQAFNIVPLYNFHTAHIEVYELWNTLTNTNSLYQLQYPLEMLCNKIALPLWSENHFSLSNLISFSTDTIKRPHQLTTSPIPSPTFVSAVELLIKVVCLREKYNPHTSYTNVPIHSPEARKVPQELLNLIASASHTTGNTSRNSGYSINNRVQRSIPLRSDPPSYIIPTTGDTNTKTHPYPSSCWLNKISFVTTSCNPDHDIHPTGEYEIIIDNNMAWYHNTNGECLAATSTNTLETLLQLYNKDLTATAESKAIICKTAATHAGRFEDPTYHPKTPIKGQNFTLPHSILQPLISAANVDTSWLSTPFTTTAGLAKFCHTKDIDSAFGTTSPAFSCQWKGRGLVIPNNNSEDIAKALKWAILSTANTTADTTTTPTYTILLCIKPESLAGINKFIHHPNVCTLLEIPTPPIIPLNSWRKTAPHAPLQNTRPLLVLAIANEPGYQQLSAQLGPLKTFIQSLNLPATTTNTKIAALEASIQAWLPKLQNNHSAATTLGLAPSKEFTKALTTPPFLTTTHILNTAEAVQTYIDSLPTTKNLKFANRRIIYTDGSKTETEISGGIYNATDNTSVHIQLIGHSPILNTCFRAEAAAICHAVDTLDPLVDITIATDSQTSMQNINNILLNPNNYRTHKHRNLLHRIINKLLSRPGKTTLIKVKAHCGISGNEQADAAATRNLNTALPTATFRTGSTGLPGREPTYLEIPGTAAPFDQTRGTVNTMWVQAGDPKTSTNLVIKALSLHQRQRKTTNPRLTELMRNRNDAIAPIDPFSIQSIATNNTIPAHLQALSARARLRHIYGNSRNHIINPVKTPSSTCTICNTGPETQGHILGFCQHPKMTSIKLNRHGKATTLIAAAIRKSTTIGNCAIFVDAEGGERTARATEHIPWYPQAPTTIDANGNTKPTSLPDILIFPKIDSAAIPPQEPATTDATTALFTPTARDKHIILIDFTITDDIKVKERFQQKLDHHNPYFTHLQTLGWKPKLYPIVFTHSGCVTTSFRTFLTDCGLTTHTINSLLKSIQLQILNYNSSILLTRYKLLTQLRTPLHLPTGVG